MTKKTFRALASAEHERQSLRRKLETTEKFVGITLPDGIVLPDDMYVGSLFSQPSEHEFLESSAQIELHEEREKIERLEASLKPFAEIGATIEPNWPGQCRLRIDARNDGSEFHSYHGELEQHLGLLPTLDEWRAAANVLADSKPVAPEEEDGSEYELKWDEDGALAGMKKSERVPPAEYQPDIAIPPGDTIKEMMDDRRMDVVDLGAELNLCGFDVADLITGKLPITIQLAYELSQLFDYRASFWLNLEANYRRNLARLAEKEGEHKPIVTGPVGTIPVSIDEVAAVMRKHAVEKMGEPEEAAPPPEIMTRWCDRSGAQLTEKQVADVMMTRGCVWV